MGYELGFTTLGQAGEALLLKAKGQSHATLIPPSQDYVEYKKRPGVLASASFYSPCLPVRQRDSGS